MIIIMEPGASEEKINKVISYVVDLGMKTIINRGVVQTVIAAIGETSNYSTEQFEILEGVRKVERIQVPFKLASRDSQHSDTVITVRGDIKIGGDNLPVIIAGPCSVENQENLLAIAKVAKECGAKI